MRYRVLACSPKRFLLFWYAFPSLFSCSTPMCKHTQTVWCGMPRTSVLLILQHADFLVVPLLIEGGGEGERGGEGREVGCGACRL